MRKVYSEFFAFCGVFCENKREIPAKCKIRKVYSRPYTLRNFQSFKYSHTITRRKLNKIFARLFEKVLQKV